MVARSSPVWAIPSTPFIGRDAELVEIRRFLADPACRLLTLIGLGGTGKTRLAIEAATQNLDQFPDGVFFVPLQAVELPEFILPAIADAAHLTSSPGANLRQQLVAFLSEKHRLIVLDSFEHLLSGVRTVLDLLQSAPQAKFLVTSREKLNVQDESVLRVGPLAYPEQENAGNAEQYAAVEMFLKLLHRLEPEIVVSSDVLAGASLICRQIQGLPLAIELAVGWADTLSLPEIAAEIARNFDFLETRMRDAPDRHRSIRAVLDPALQTLSDDDCAVFESLCLFRGSFTREAAEVIAGASLHSLALLVNKSLIHHLPSGRYEIHELLRQYGEARLNSVVGQHEAAQERYCAYYANFLEVQRQEMKIAVRNVPFERMDDESANIIIAFSSMIENRNAAQICQSMYGLADYCLIRSKYSEGMILFQRCIEVLHGDPAHEALLGNLLVQLAFFKTILGALGESDEGERLVEEGLMTIEKYRREMSADALITGYLLATILYYFAMKPQRMKQVAQKGLSYATENDDVYGIRYLTGYLALAECLLGNYDEAKNLGHICYDLALKRGDLWLQGGVTRLVLGEVAFARMEYAEARQWCRIALNCFEDVHQYWTLAATTSMLTACAVALKDFADAHTQLNVCLHYFEENGTIWEIPAMLLSVARLLAQQRMTEQAVEMLPYVLRHPACRKSTYDGATAFLHQLESSLPAMRFTSAWERGQSRHPIQVLADLASPADADAAPKAGSSVLSERELEVLRLIAEGLSNAEIAQRLYLSTGTVKVHIRHIFDKLDAKSRTQALANAQELGIQ